MKFKKTAAVVGESEQQALRKIEKILSTDVTAITFLGINCSFHACFPKKKGDENIVNERIKS